MGECARLCSLLNGRPSPETSGQASWRTTENENGRLKAAWDAAAAHAR